jgi:uncharacterized protein YciI
MWYFCQRRNLRPREHRVASLKEHLTWMKNQHEAGKIVLSGPSPDHSLGMYLIRAGSREEGESIAASDPFTAAGDCDYTLFDWHINEIMGVGFRNLDELE